MIKEFYRKHIKPTLKLIENIKSFQTSRDAGIEKSIELVIPWEKTVTDLAQRYENFTALNLDTNAIFSELLRDAEQLKVSVNDLKNFASIIFFWSNTPSNLPVFNPVFAKQLTDIDTELNLLDKYIKRLKLKIQSFNYETSFIKLTNTTIAAENEELTVFTHQLGNRLKALNVTDADINKIKEIAAFLLQGKEVNQHLINDIIERIVDKLKRNLNRPISQTQSQSYSVDYKIVLDIVSYINHKLKIGNEHAELKKRLNKYIHRTLKDSVAPDDSYKAIKFAINCYLNSGLANENNNTTDLDKVNQLFVDVLKKSLLPLNNHCSFYAKFLPIDFSKLIDFIPKLQDHFAQIRANHMASVKSFTF